jgi:hypothetical protein
MKNAFVTTCAMAALIAAMWASPVQAADVTVTVTLSGVSVSVTGGPIAFGTVVANSTTISTVIEVTNDGSVPETYSLSLTDPTDWTAVQVDPSVAETYCLSAMFNSDNAGTFVRADHALTTAPVACSATKFAGDEDGFEVAVGAPHNHLWLAFEAPPSSAHYTQQTITVTITAADAS